MLTQNSYEWQVEMERRHFDVSWSRTHEPQSSGENLDFCDLTQKVFIALDTADQKPSKKKKRISEKSKTCVCANCVFFEAVFPALVIYSGICRRSTFTWDGTLSRKKEWEKIDSRAKERKRRNQERRNRERRNRDKNKRDKNMKSQRKTKYGCIWLQEKESIA